MLESSFKDYLKRPEQKINIVEASLLLAKEEYTDIDVASYLQQVDAITQSAQKQVGRYDTLNEAVSTLSDYIFNKLGFAGDKKNYYDPRNSYLNHVIDRKLGIPITLSVLYTEIGLRLGMPLVGVGFPTHFLVKCVTPEYDLLIDCFNQGRIITISDCKKMINEIAGENAKFHTSMLEPTKPKEILIRTLQNLKVAYLRANEYTKAMKAVEFVNLVRPNLPHSLKDKAEIYIAQQDFPSALEMLEKYIASHKITKAEKKAANIELTYVKRALIGLN